VLLGHVAQGLRLEAGLVGAAFISQRRTTVDLGDEAGLVEQIEIAAHGHVAHAEQRGELADAHGAPATHLGDDHLMALSSEAAGAARLDPPIGHERQRAAG